MVALPTDVASNDFLSLDDLKTELRVGGRTPASRATLDYHDALITSQFLAAVNRIEALSGLPIWDRTEIRQIRPPVRGTDAVLVAAPAIQSVDAVAYYGSADDPGIYPPPKRLDVSTLSGRYEEIRDGGGRVWVVYAPVSGWPMERHRLAPMVFTLTCGLIAGDLRNTALLRLAVIQVVRTWYHGYPETPTFLAGLKNLIWPVGYRVHHGPSIDGIW